MLSTSPQSPAGSTRHRWKQWQDSSGLARAGCKEQILLACEMGDSCCACFLGKQHSKLGQPRNFTPLYNLDHAMAKNTASPVNL